MAADLEFSRGELGEMWGRLVDPMTALVRHRRSTRTHRQGLRCLRLLRRLLRSLHWKVGIQPRQGTFHDVPTVSGSVDLVALAGIDHELRGDAQRFEGVPELTRLGNRAFQVALTHKDERWCFHALDESDGRTARVNLGVIIHGGAEVGDQPLIDAVLAVIALPVGDAGAGDGGAKALGLRDGPHRHVAAVTPAGDGRAIFIYRGRLQDFVNSGEDVAQVAVAEVLHISARELLAVAVTAARVGKEYEIALCGKNA